MYFYYVVSKILIAYVTIWLYFFSTIFNHILIFNMIVKVIFTSCEIIFFQLHSY
jgi:hypothetical protein